MTFTSSKEIYFLRQRIHHLEVVLVDIAHFQIKRIHALTISSRRHWVSLGYRSCSCLLIISPPTKMRSHRSASRQMISSAGKFRNNLLTLLKFGTLENRHKSPVFSKISRILNSNLKWTWCPLTANSRALLKRQSSGTLTALLPRKLWRKTKTLQFLKILPTLLPRSLPSTNNRLTSWSSPTWLHPMTSLSLRLSSSNLRIASHNSTWLNKNCQSRLLLGHRRKVTWSPSSRHQPQLQIRTKTTRKTQGSKKSASASWRQSTARDALPTKKWLQSSQNKTSQTQATSILRTTVQTVKSTLQVDQTGNVGPLKTKRKTYAAASTTV